MNFLLCEFSYFYFLRKTHKELLNFSSFFLFFHRFLGFFWVATDESACFTKLNSDFFWLARKNLVLSDFLYFASVLYNSFTCIWWRFFFAAVYTKHPKKIIWKCSIFFRLYKKKMREKSFKKLCTHGGVCMSERFYIECEEGIKGNLSYQLK